MSALDSLEASVRALVDTASEIDAENASLRRDAKRLQRELDDACDSIEALRRQVRERDELIAELQQLAYRAVGT